MPPDDERQLAKRLRFAAPVLKSVFATFDGLDLEALVKQMPDQTLEWRAFVAKQRWLSRDLPLRYKFAATGSKHPKVIAQTLHGRAGLRAVDVNAGKREIDLHHFILDANDEPKAVDLLEWAEWFQTAERKVANDELPHASISTVFLGIDHSMGRGPPVLYETMIFWGDELAEAEEYQTRSSTRLQAFAEHKLAVEHARRAMPLEVFERDAAMQLARVQRAKKGRP